MAYYYRGRSGRMGRRTHWITWTIEQIVENSLGRFDWICILIASVDIGQIPNLNYRIHVIKAYIRNRCKLSSGIDFNLGIVFHVIEMSHLITATFKHCFWWLSRLISSSSHLKSHPGLHSKSPITSIWAQNHEPFNDSYSPTYCNSHLQGTH